MGWRTKFVFLLIVYAAGFATAIYCLAPAPDQKAPPSQRAGTSFNAGMHKCVGFSKEAALEAAKLIETKVNELAKGQPQE
jgi:hypothetical protein